MFNPFLLRTSTQSQEESSATQQKEKVNTPEENSHSAMTHIQASAAYLPQFQYYYTPNGPIAVPTGFPLQNWNVPGMSQFSIPAYNYYIPGGIQYPVPQSRPLIDPTTGRLLSDPQPQPQPQSQHNFKQVKTHKQQKPQKHAETLEDPEHEPLDAKISLTGLLDPKMNTREEIQKWLAARRKNFPTRANMARKEAELRDQGELGKLQESELSQLEIKLRKKIAILDYDPFEEKRTKRAKRGLLKRINSGKRYRTGVFKKEKEEDGTEEEMEKSEDNQKRPTSEKDSTKCQIRERSRHDKKNDTRGMSKAKRIKMKAKQREETENRNAFGIDQKPKTNEEIIDELKKEADNLVPEEKNPEQKKPAKTHSAQEIIEHLKTRKHEDQLVVDNFLNDKTTCDKFRYHQNNLLSNLLLEDVFKERNIMLQALRYLVKNNFLQETQVSK